MRKPIFLALVLFWMVYLISTALAQNVRSYHQVSQVGIVADSPFQHQLRVTTQAVHLAAKSTELLNELGSENLAFGYLPVVDAVSHYLAGESLTAVAGCSHSTLGDWLLVTRPDVIRNAPEQVRAAVIQFQSDAASTSCTLVPLEEKTLTSLAQHELFVNEKRKINLSWFIDLSFLPASSFSQAN